MIADTVLSLQKGAVKVMSRDLDLTDDIKENAIVLDCGEGLSLLVMDKVAHPELKEKRTRRVKNERFRLIDLDGWKFK